MTALEIHTNETIFGTITALLPSSSKEEKMKRLPLSTIVLFLMVAEILSIVLMTGWLGGFWTLLLMAASFAVGVLMLRNLGFSSVLLAGSVLRQPGAVSLYQLLWPIRYIVAALLLLSPGFVSTLLALALMLPLQGGRPVSAKFTAPDDNVIDGQFSTVQPHDTQTTSHTPLIGHEQQDDAMRR